MNFQELSHFIFEQRSFLCVGLDSDINFLPQGIERSVSGMLTFNKDIIDATAPHCVAFKPNTAFYEVHGAQGWDVLHQTIKYIKQYYPQHLVIADAKRGDIGNTAAMYAKTFFEQLNADAVTVAPYMGSDSIKPFLEYPNKWTIILGLTSNRGAEDFQLQGNPPLYQTIVKKAASWGNANNTMFVFGATQAQMIGEIRTIIPKHFLLVPGVGAQGGSLNEVAKHGLNQYGGLLVNASRSVIYASSSADFAQKAQLEAKEMQITMEQLLQKHCKK